MQPRALVRAGSDVGCLFTARDRFCDCQFAVCAYSPSAQTAPFWLCRVRPYSAPVLYSYGRDALWQQGDASNTRLPFLYFQA